MKTFLPLLLLLPATLGFADDSSEIAALKKRLEALENKTSAPVQTTSQPQANAFNPAISLILDGHFASYENNPDNYVLPGFLLGEESGLAQEGFAIGESELTANANVDQLFTAQFTVAFANDAGETVSEVEEAFFETLVLGEGFTVRAGRFKSALGYLNQQHAHVWDFADAPLVYSALWGGGYGDDGVRVSWITPTDLFLELGAEGFANGSTGADAKIAFVNLGGDIDESQSWQAGLSYYTADPDQRESATATDTASFSGSSDVTGVNAVYKWAPNGNYKERFFKLQGEYFYRDESGKVSMLTSLNETTYKGTQDGYYIEGVYQFAQQWRTGLRYDSLASDNRGSDLVGTNVLDEAGLVDHGMNPDRISAMLEFDPSEFSRIRLQFNHDQSYQDTDNQVILQYTMSLGAHGAHSY